MILIEKIQIYLYPRVYLAAQQQVTPLKFHNEICCLWAIMLDDVISCCIPARDRQTDKGEPGNSTQRAMHVRCKRLARYKM